MQIETTSPRRERDDNVNGTERWISLLAGTVLALAGLKRGGAGGIALAAAGAIGVKRGATGFCEIYDALGISSAGDRGAASQLADRTTVRLEHAVTVNRPREELYRHWRRLENLPGIMSHLESVTEETPSRSRWRAKAPLGTHVEWEAEITEDRPGERIAWRSVEGSTIPNTGSVAFRDAPAGRGTELTVRIEYAPPAGALGEAAANLLREVPRRQIPEDLRRFKQRMEAGEIPTTEGQPSGRKSEDA